MTIVFSVCTLFLLFFFKHYLADFQWQTSYHLQKFSMERKIQLKALASHSSVHAFLCYMALMMHYLVFGVLPLTVDFALVILSLSFLDFALHFIIDFVKVEATRGVGVDQRKFWLDFGLDQLSHYVTYCPIIFIYFLLQVP